MRRLPLYLKSKSSIESITPKDTKIFFVSNQNISDKKRAETEDALRGEYGLDIRIFDKNWLLDKVFSSRENMIIACQCFRITEKIE